MSDLVWPPSLRQSSVTWRNISNTEMYTAPLTGGIQTNDRPGARLACTVRVTGSTGSERRRLRALAAALRGMANRIYVPDLAFQRAGSFSTSELFSNSDFSNGTTGWTAGANATLSVSDGTMKLAVISPGAAVTFSQSILPTQYAPYALRSVIAEGNAAGLSIGPFLNLLAGVSGADGSSTTRGYRVASGVSLNTSAQNQYPCSFTPTSGYMSGNHALTLFTSLARCMLADGGANLQIQSDDFANAAWTVSTNNSISSNAFTSPDGTSTADILVEGNTANIEHSVSSTAAITVSSVTTAEYALSVAVFAGNRAFVLLRIQETTSSTTLNAWFNVNTGVVGTVNAGANWANARSFMTSLGGGWYQCTVIGRKTNAATGIKAVINSATADNIVTYAGTAANNAIVLWRATLSQSSVPTRLRQTTSAAIAADSQSGSAIYVKGGPASTSGALKVGDTFEIDKQMKFCTAPLDFDASGLGYLQFEPSLPRGVADNTPIIVQSPMCKMVMTNEPEYECVPGSVSDFSFEFQQDLGA